MVATEEVWMPREVHSYDLGSTNLNDGVCLSWRGSLGIVQCYKWGQSGCALAPMLFSIFLSAMLDEAFRDTGNGVYIQS